MYVSDFQTLKQLRRFILHTFRVLFIVYRSRQRTRKRKFESRAVSLFSIYEFSWIKHTERGSLCTIIGTDKLNKSLLGESKHRVTAMFWGVFCVFSEGSWSPHGPWSTPLLMTRCSEVHAIMWNESQRKYIRHKLGTSVLHVTANYCSLLAHLLAVSKHKWEKLKF